MDSLEQLRHEGILDMISQLGTLTDEELESLIQSTVVGVAQMTIWMALLYNPIIWIMGVLFFGIAFSNLYWWCKNNLELRGSWKKLDKSLHWKEKQMDSIISEIANVGLTLLFVVLALGIINYLRENL